VILFVRYEWATKQESHTGRNAGMYILHITLETKLLNKKKQYLKLFFVSWCTISLLKN